MSAKLKWLFGGIGLLMVAAIAFAVVSGVRFWNMHSEESARNSSLQAAREYTVTMFSRNPKNVSENINTTMGFLTGAAKDEMQRNVTEHKIAEIVKRDKIVTVATVEGAGVMENTRDTSKVLVYLNLSSSRNSNADEVQVDQSRIVYDMVRRDGKWLIGAMDILTDDSLASRVQKSDGPPPSGAVEIPSGSPSSPAPSAPAPFTQPAG